MKYFTCRQNTITDFYHSFDSTRSQITYNSLVTFTDESKTKPKCLYQINNSFYYRHRPGCSRLIDSYNPWRIPEEPDDCSREDISRTYRLGEGF